MAVHILSVLAYKENEGVTSGLLASSVNTNPVVVRRLLRALQDAKLVATRKGAGLGSQLGRSPDRISMADVYRAVETEEPFALPRKEPNRACPVGQHIQDALETVFLSTQAALERELGKTTLADILESLKASCSRAG
jgi:Rrf2 family protein